jgi:hypothetical protein
MSSAHGNLSTRILIINALFHSNSHTDGQKLFHIWATLTYIFFKCNRTYAIEAQKLLEIHYIKVRRNVKFWQIIVLQSDCSSRHLILILYKNIFVWGLQSLLHGFCAWMVFISGSVSSVIIVTDTMFHLFLVFSTCCTQWPPSSPNISKTHWIFLHIRKFSLSYS